MKTKDELENLKGTQIEDYNDLFDVIGPNNIVGYGEEHYLESLVTDVDSDDEDI